ncbi:hypothetical protein [Inquilinus limosus]|uniref:Uncharacterized protein n=1 Tax=Inquilinus limosus TaxID=171674 RepID=A0A211ZFH4_9PROT|nr:hypothetical protein [Inquilinus limosus]OWJ64038.1 hypothetical protein BWR60_26920 [Inquilinus limosus]
MLRTTLANFLMTGRAGAIGEGSTRAEVWRVFGRPGAWLWREPQRASACWWYGSLEIGFDGRTGPLDRIGYIQIESRDSHGRFGGDRRVRLHDGGFRAAVADRAGLKRFARRHGIPLIPVHTQRHGEGFLAPGGVTVWFADDPPSDISPDGTFITERLDLCSPLAIPAPTGFLRRCRGQALRRPAS